ncbi:TPA: hypothetical protein DCL28_00705 [Candidatus Komeilibacteria bacterium]|nr:MAG: RNA polymerase sigma factor, sigma-70 family [Parcubacteria group bacterium GW2011_GWF2_45_11]KKT98703.1 MAG: RNA polymerase sigma factor, sigma-70 family [Parcubacteria group bacterium GW2011_GWC2_45_15]OGY93629.1 MAG: hypothetical protein A2260_03125 [Candidatus Komeilibacteria bacterium RIFOXYA2_FULL_45_9]OGY94585.1 MAG: hypothetical protein A3J95_03995 [Candidatus Komeilibacteria bacterium RIFOXYC2_FULL_45_12]HAH04063.1 hypothetical protein [Candidatus Komeilibacteria bacterium]
MTDLSQERELVINAQKNPAAFNKLYQLYFDKIYHFILARAGQVELAEDITSQTFVNALENMAKFRWRNVSFGAWLYRIAINNLNSYYRKHNRLVVTEEETLISLADQQLPPLEPYADFDEQIRITELKKAVDQLPDFEKNLVALRYFQEKSYEEIAEILNLSVNAVGVKLHRALKKVRKIINL